MVDILQNFVAFSEYMNFEWKFIFYLNGFGLDLTKILDQFKEKACYFMKKGPFSKL